MSDQHHAQFVSCRIFALLLIGVLAAACGDESTEAPAAAVPLIEAVQVTRGGLPRVETVHGVVRAENQVAVRAEVSASVSEILVGSGEAVSRGEVLVRLEDHELREQLRQAEADVRLAEASALEVAASAAELASRVARLRTLAGDQLISPQELETREAQLAGQRASSQAASARVDVARATADERRAALAKTVVRSPITGRVGSKQVEVGTLVEYGTVLFRVGNLDRVTVELPISEEMLGQLDEGQEVRVGGRGTETKVTASLSRVSPFLEEGSFTTTGEIDLDNRDGRFRPGMFVVVEVLLGVSEEMALIPASALWESSSSGRPGVYVVDPEGVDWQPSPPSDGLPVDSDRAHPVSFRSVDVTIEAESNLGVEGVLAGEWVVVTGQQMLDDSASEAVRARVRPVSWARVQHLQGLQREDLLEEFLDKQQRISRVLGTEIPESEAVVDELLRGGNGSALGGG